MKQKINYKGKDVEIDLTPQQIQRAMLQSISYTDIKTLEDALAYLGETTASFEQRTAFDDDAQKAYKELEVICQAVRQGNELGEFWYYPWFTSIHSSLGFSYCDFGYGSAGAFVGSRLCIETSEKAAYIGRQFIDIYYRYINGAKLSQPLNVTSKKKTFKDYTEIKTFKNACEALGLNENTFHIEHKSLPDDVYAYMQLRIISKALNTCENSEYAIHDERTYFPYFYSVRTPKGYSYVFGGKSAGSGVRLTYKTAEVAEYAGKQFLTIYNRYMS
ncbi:hypothetical protein [Sphingobacterium corticibacter]|nr:hypothetical protein [Sphingobacterium corticibacter]